MKINLNYNQVFYYLDLYPQLKLIYFNHYFKNNYSYHYNSILNIYFKGIARKINILNVANPMIHLYVG